MSKSRVLVPKIMIYATDELPLNFLRDSDKGVNEQVLQDFFARFLGPKPTLKIRRDLGEVVANSRFSGEKVHFFSGSPQIPFSTEIYYYLAQKASLTLVRGLSGSAHYASAYLQISGPHSNQIQQVARKIGLIPYKK